LKIKIQGAVYDRAYLSIREKRALIERAYNASILVFRNASAARF
jgi:hypothetical protein